MRSTTTSSLNKKAIQNCVRWRCIEVLGAATPIANTWNNIHEAMELLWQSQMVLLHVFMILYSLSIDM
nr:hypothetical protein Itr_chr12CG09320 [Ipomoea trifida]GMD63086.1 hypothetical protein Iba_chr12bCG11540 [Ipomoea batatas]